MTYDNYNLDNAAELRAFIIRITDGVWNSSDTAAFDDGAVAILNRIRDFDRDSN